MPGTWGGLTDRHVYQARWQWTLGSNVQQTGCKFVAAGVNMGDAAEVAAAVEDFVNDSFRTILNTGSRVLGVDVVDLSSQTGSSTSPANMMGTLAVSAGTPGFTAVAVSLRGTLRARYGHGRMFFPVQSEAHTTWDTLDTAGQAAIQAVIDEMSTRFIGNTATGYNLVNAHGAIPARAATATRPARAAVVPMYYEVASIRLNPALTSLRSRKAGKGS